MKMKFPPLKYKENHNGIIVEKQKRRKDKLKSVDIKKRRNQVKRMNEDEA